MFQNNEQLIIKTLKAYKFPESLALYTVMGQFLFEFRSAGGGAATGNKVVSCLVTPCSDLMAGYFPHKLEFPVYSNTENSLTKEKINKIIDEAVQEAIKCKVEKH